MKIAWISFAAVLATSLVSLAADSAAAKGSAPLPECSDVIKRLVESAKREADNEARFRAAYAFTRTKVTEERTPGGELKESKEKVRTYEPAPAEQVEAGMDETGKTSATLESTGEGKAADKRDLPLDDDTLSRFDFKLVRRELFEGRPVLVIDFSPADRKLPVKNFKDHFINRAAGRLWVDEEDGVLSKVDVRLTEPVEVAIGILGAVKSFNYKFERDRTEDGLWFTRAVNWRLDARRVWSRKIVDFSETRTDVRKVR